MRGSRWTSGQIAQAMDRVFALDDFDSVQYELQGDPANPTLAVQLKEKSASPNILRFDLGLEVGTDGNTAFSVGGDYLRPWINPLGGEVHGHLQFGGAHRTSACRCTSRSAIGTSGSWSPACTASARSRTSTTTATPSAATNSRADTASWTSAASSAPARSCASDSATARRRRNATSTVPQFPEVDAEGYAGWTLGFTYDDLDAVALATQGWLARLRYYRSEEALGAAEDYDRLEGMVMRSVPLWGNVLYLRVMGGTSFGTQLPLYDTFALGGPASLPGLSTGQLRGESYWAVTSGVSAQDRRDQSALRAGAVSRLQPHGRGHVGPRRHEEHWHDLLGRNRTGRANATRAPYAFARHRDDGRLADRARHRPPDRRAQRHRPGLVTAG